MWRSILAIGAGALLALSSAAAAYAGLSPQVVGGSEAKIEQVPFQVALYDPQVSADPADSQFCGGVIIDATHVITAAHCVFDQSTVQAAAPGEIEVLAGTENLTDAASGVEDPVQVTSFNPEWNPQTAEHDDAVLTLADPLWSTSTPPAIGAPTKIAPIGLAVSLPTPPETATVSGWGYTEELRGEQQPTPKEAEKGFLPTLRLAQLPLITPQACAQDYEVEEEETLGPDFLCAGEQGKDSCYGDSGGPLFTGAPGSPTDQLIATVDLGHGCGQNGFPGIYQSVVQHQNRAFLTSNPPQAPYQPAGSTPNILGSAQPGQTLTCQAGPWVGEPQLRYGFFRDESEFAAPGTFTELSVGEPTYTLGALTPPGTRVFCAVLAQSAGGYGQAASRDVTVLGAPQQPPPVSPPPAAVTPTPPTLRVVSERCGRSSCTVNVLASQGSADAAVATVRAALTSRRRVSCRKHGKPATCTRTATRQLVAKATPGGHFVITASGLKSASYTMSLTAIDKAGVSQVKPTSVRLTPKPRAPRKPGGR